MGKGWNLNSDPHASSVNALSSWATSPGPWPPPQVPEIPWFWFLNIHLFLLHAYEHQVSYMYVHHMHAWSYGGRKRDWIESTRASHSCEPACGCCKSNLGPLQQQSVFSHLPRLLQSCFKCYHHLTGVKLLVFLKAILCLSLELVPQQSYKIKYILFFLIPRWSEKQWLREVKWLAQSHPRKQTAYTQAQIHVPHSGRRVDFLTALSKTSSYLILSVG